VLLLHTYQEIGDVRQLHCVLLNTEALLVKCNIMQSLRGWVWEGGTK
jgi:hypothetical protein